VHPEVQIPLCTATVAQDTVSRAIDSTLQAVRRQLKLDREIREAEDKAAIIRKQQEQIRQLSNKPRDTCITIVRVKEKERQNIFADYSEARSRLVGWNHNRHPKSP
jgi:hypothetical protein